MRPRTQLVWDEAAQWLGDWHPLTEQLGTTEGLLPLCSVSDQLGLQPVDDLSSLKRFLESYRAQLLLPVELPAVQSAFHHACRNEVRELVALDEQIAGNAIAKTFAQPSRRVGQFQLQKLRPLRDERVVQRYLHAVDEGRAQGWHTLVYGLTLAVYSLPLRQGLSDYARQILWGFIQAAALPLRLTEQQARELFDEVCEPLPKAVDALFQQSINGAAARIE